MIVLQPWPIVESFLNGLPDGSIGLEVGCGNGKYLGVNSNVFIVASDRSVLSNRRKSITISFSLTLAVSNTRVQI